MEVKGLHYTLIFDAGRSMSHTPSGKGWTSIQIKGDYPYDFEQVRQTLLAWLGENIETEPEQVVSLTYGLELAGETRRSRLDEAGERSLRLAAIWDEVKDRLDEPAIALSGGQQQRLCLAGVLALQPQVVLLDEPISGLDPISTGKVEAALQELKKDYTIILVPHSVQQAGRTADHAAFFLQGELVEFRPSREIFTNPKDKRTEDYVTGRFG
ncbi:ATP-binding cassette domain-containing protein [Patescibacteria group bacterium]|nr:ATP-binding cassette domain-containing protein [Patescibacteria group bacterium]